jgi:hypothetical protein
MMRRKSKHSRMTSMHERVKILNSRGFIVLLTWWIVSSMNIKTLSSKNYLNLKI